MSFARNLSSGTATVTSGIGSVAGSASISGNVMTVNLTGVADAQTLTLTLSGLTDTDGRAIPDTTLPISFLLGDANGDGVVNSADATLVRNNSGQAVDATNFRSDLNADGSINSADATIVRARSGAGLNARLRSLAASAQAEAQ